MKNNDIEEIGFSLLDDEIAAHVFGKGGEEACEEVITVATQEIIHVTESIEQEYVQRLPNDKASIFDAHCKDEFGNHIDIEVQNCNKDNILKRCRFYGSQLDTSIMKPGMKYEEMPNVIIIFICRTCPFPDRVVRKKIITCDEETKEKVETGKTYVVFSLDVALKKGTKDEKRIAHDFLVNNADEIATTTIKKRVKSVYGRIKKIMKMSEERKINAFNDGLKVGKAQGIELGKTQGEAIGAKKARVASMVALVKNGMPLEEASRILEAHEDETSEAKLILSSQSA